jgi:hypothetical protein
MCRAGLALCASLLLCGMAAEAPAGDAIRYLACRADNEEGQSIIAIDDASKRICDREFAPDWMTPLVFNSTTIEWGDGPSRKSITRGKKGSRYEHDTYFIMVHIGHCSIIKTPPPSLCNG